MIKVKRRERNFPEMTSLFNLVEHMSVHDDKCAFKYFDKNHDLIEVTYKEFQTQVFSEAAGFIDAGLGGKRIAVIGETSTFWISTYLAAIIAGGVAVPLDKDLKPEEISAFLAFAEIDAIVYGESYHDKFEFMRSSHPCVHVFLPMGDTIQEQSLGDTKIIPLNDLISRGRDAYETAQILLCPPENVDRMAVMLFTSGTTGSSKCVMLSERNIVSSCNSAYLSVNFFKEDVTVSVLPVHHTYELCITLAALRLGVTICINDSLRRVLKNFAYFQPTALILVPLFVNTMYKKIMEEVRRQNMESNLKTGLKISKVARIFHVDLSKKLFGQITAAFGGHLKQIICGGAPLNPEMVDVFGEFGIQICEGYGITECSPLVAVTPYYAPKHGSVGPSVPSCVVSIDTGTNDIKNEAGFVEGEICVKGDNVMLGYYKNEAATEEAFTEDGYFRTGDIGYKDKDGYIFITGRKKSVIVLENGKNVFPEELEEYLYKIDEISECVVVGRKEDDGETVYLVALVYPNRDAFPSGTPDEEIQSTIESKVQELNKHLVRYKQIRSVEFRDCEFEKTTSKKIKRFLLK